MGLNCAKMRVATAVVILTVAALCAGKDPYHPRDHLSRRAKTHQASRTLHPEQTAEFWFNEAQAGIKEREEFGATYVGGKAKNVIMFLGDGMSVPTLAAARTLLGQRSGRTGEEEKMFFEKFPTVGMSKTYCVDAQVADSACSATAYLRGVKNNEATIGVTAAVPYGGCDESLDESTHVKSILEWALQAGRDAGIVTTTRVTHASPSGAYANVANRYWENDAEVKSSGFDTQRCPDIASQLVHSYPATHFKVILGGGRKQFLPNTTLDEEGTRGSRTDGRNLIEEWVENKASRGVSHHYVWNRQQMLEASVAGPDYMLGLFEGDHMEYHLEANPRTEPTLAEMTEVAIRSLSRNEKGFFLFVESGRIDHGHHDNLIEKALDETIEMDMAVRRAAQMLSRDDTLIVVTADHSHVLGFNGYSPRGHDVLGPANDYHDTYGVPFMTLSYTNGPGARKQVDGIRPDPTQDENYRDINWMTHADAPIEWETHGGDDVPVFALGPQHGMFSGLYEQSQIPYLMAYASCIGPGAHAAPCSGASSLQAPLLALAATLVTLRAVLR